MNKKTNWNHLIQRESVRVEWKENVADEKGVVKTLCAFANDIQQVGGGRVICGLREEKNQYGETVAKAVGLNEKRFTEIKNKVLSICHRHVEPPLKPTVNEHPVDEDPAHRILIFEVTSSPFAHRYRIKGEGAQYYVRVNDRTQLANGLIPQLMEQKKSWPPYLDQTHPEANLDAIDRFALKEFLGKRQLPLPLEDYLEPDTRFRGDVQSLATFPPGGSENPVPRNFAILLFGREPHLFFRGAYAILSIYDGIDKTADRSQRFEIFGPIPLLIRNLVEKLQLHMGMEIDKTADMLNGGQNRPRYSDRAVTEAIVNAFVHRDYHSHEPVRVTVFSDRMEITNPGGVYNGIDIEKLQKGIGPPSWRNPSLAWFMVALEYAQNEGRGIAEIVKETKRIANKAPVFDITGNWFNLVIPAFVQRKRLAPETGTVAAVEETGKDGLLLVSIGGESIEKQVKESLESLGLKEAEIAVNYAYKDYVEGPTEKWEEIAQNLKKEIQQVVDSPDYARFHLFYRGPVVFPPLLGALIAPAKRLLFYNYENGRYFYTYAVDRKFIKG